MLSKAEGASLGDTALNTSSVKDLQNQSRKGQGIEKLKGFIVVLYAAKSRIFGIFVEGFVQ